jgi:hypothetical protein
MPFATDGKEIFKTTYAYTTGLPRDTVKVCDELLRDLFVKNKKQATALEVEEIATELNLRL